MIKVVPSSDPHCLTAKPKEVDPVVGELADTSRATHPKWDQVDRLAAAYLDAYKYQWRAWRVCGTVPVRDPAAGSGAGSGSGAP